MLNYKGVIAQRLAQEIFNSEEKGQGLVEYALIIFLVAVLVIGILVIMGPQIGSVFSAITKGLANPLTIRDQD